VQPDATTVLLADAAATRQLGAMLADACRPGSVILLKGPLGAGKTTFADGFIAALGAGSATSPTFVIAHSHRAGRVPVWHLDLYRLEDEGQVAELDLAQYVRDDAITLCEWPERGGSVWPADSITVELSAAGHGRRARIAAGGPGSRAAMDACLRAWANTRTGA
jgi:tRNA threonylcarbamoyl adenosine modification protein YjeE